MKTDYKCYAFYRIDGCYKWVVYTGETDDFAERCRQHLLCIGAIYKKNCPGGKKGEVRNIDTEYGKAAHHPLYHFIRNDCGGLEGRGVLWDVEELDTSQGQTEGDYVDMFIAHGHVIFNQKSGIGHDKYRCASRPEVDLSNLEGATKVKQHYVEYDAEQARQDALNRANALRERKLQEEERREELRIQQEQMTEDEQRREEEAVEYYDSQMQAIWNKSDHLQDQMDSADFVSEQLSQRIVSLCEGCESRLEVSTHSSIEDLEDDRKAQWRLYFKIAKSVEHSLKLQLEVVFAKKRKEREEREKKEREAVKVIQRLERAEKREKKRAEDEEARRLKEVELIKRRKEIKIIDEKQSLEWNRAATFLEKVAVGFKVGTKFYIPSKYSAGQPRSKRVWVCAMANELLDTARPQWKGLIEGWMDIFDKIEPEIKQRQEAKRLLREAK